MCARWLGLALIAATLSGCDGGATDDWRILFESNRDGDWALYSIDPEGGGAVRIVRLEGGDGSRPLPSPDGRRLLLAEHGISVVDTDGAGRRHLSRGNQSSASWSPDGKRIVFSSDVRPRLFVIGVDGTGKRTLSRRDAWTPSWSPDGNWIAYAGTDGVFLVRPDGTGRRRLTAYVTSADSTPAWSPDARRVAFVGGPESLEEADLYVVDVATRATRRLARYVQTAAWAPDGTTIAYDAGPRGPTEISLVRRDGTGRRRLTFARHGESSSAPVWSPDGRRLVFLRRGDWRHPGELELVQLWSMNADGSDQRPLTRGYPDGGDNFAPSWGRGPVRAEPRPPLRARRSGEAIVLRVPFAVDELSADGGRVAVGSPGRPTEPAVVQPGAPLVVWEPASGRTMRLAAQSCDPRDLTLVGLRLAFDCDQSGIDVVAQSVRVFDLRRRRPATELFFGHNGPRWINGGTFLDRIQGDAGLLVFGTEWTDSRGVIVGRRLWRVDGSRKSEIAGGGQAGALLSVDGSRIALGVAGGRIALLRTDGGLSRVLTPRGLAPPPRSFWTTPERDDVLLAGRRLLLLNRDALDVYDTVSGRLELMWPLPPGRKRLQAAEGGLVVYTRANGIHVLRLADGRGTVVRVPALGLRQLERRGYYKPYRVDADLTPAGLFYAYDVDDVRNPGRVVFLPWAALVERLGLR
jgi:Tol biopolymer transport system component